MYILKSKDAVISFEQEEAIRYYLDNQIQIERDIQKMLLNFFHTSDCSLIEKSIQIEGLNFTRNGAISIGLISDFSDEFLENILEKMLFLQILLGCQFIRLRQCFQMRKYITTSIINTKETSFNMNVFDSIITGLNEAVDYEKGKISAKKQLLE